MPEDIGTWPPVIAVLALAVVALKLVLDHMAKRGGSLPESGLSKLAATLKTIDTSMRNQTDVLRRVAEETHDLHQWHDETDPTTGMKRWYVDPSIKSDVDDLHNWGIEERASSKAKKGE